MKGSAYDLNDAVRHAAQRGISAYEVDEQIGPSTR